jgi:hypothetical protein
MCTEVLSSRGLWVFDSEFGFAVICTDFRLNLCTSILRYKHSTFPMIHSAYTKNRMQFREITDLCNVQCRTFRVSQFHDSQCVNLMTLIVSQTHLSHLLILFRVVKFAKIRGPTYRIRIMTCYRARSYGVLLSKVKVHNTPVWPRICGVFPTSAMSASGHFSCQ